jgi:taurine dioxygenase
LKREGALSQITRDPTPNVATEPDFLQDLTDRITQPQFCYAHEYEKGDLLIIDDRASLHQAGFYYDHSQPRRLYQMLVRGDRPY